MSNIIKSIVETGCCLEMGKINFNNHILKIRTLENSKKKQATKKFDFLAFFTALTSPQVSQRTPSDRPHFELPQYIFLSVADSSLFKKNLKFGFLI